MSNGSSRARWKRVRDWLLYVVIAAVVFAVVGVFAIHQAKTGGSPDLPLKWLGFVGITAIIFGYAILAYRRSWGRRQLWLLLTAFFIMHSGAGVFVLTRLTTVSLILYGLLTGIEYLCLVRCLDFFLNSN
jgi:Na+/melibiose symporter-like transporter